VSPHYTNRATLYGVGGIPDSFVNGYLNTGSLSVSTLEYYYNDIQNEDSPLDIQISYTSHPENGLNLIADIEVTGNVTTGNNHIFFVITDYYDYEYFSLERKMEQQDFNLTSVGSSETYTQQMEIDPAWTFNNINAIVFVQTLSGDKRILQVRQIPIDLNAEVDGIVVDAFTQEPISNALIQCGSFSDYTNAAGEYAIELIAGEYNLSCSADNYENFSDTFNVTTGSILTIDIELNERLLPPNNLVAEWIDEDVELNWNYPGVYTGFTENFEAGVLPENWQLISNEDEGWIITDDGSSSGFTVPDHGTYAISNDDGNNDDSSMDYLILPPQDFSRLYEIDLSFQSYYTGLYGEIATLEFSVDEGENWTVLSEIPEENSWQQINLVFTDVCGQGFDNVWLAFHADDGGSWSSGWAIDDIVLGEGGASRDFLGYNLYEEGSPNSLNSELISSTNYQLTNVSPEDHTFFVTAVYISGESEASNAFDLVFVGIESQLLSNDHHLTAYPNPFNPTTTISFSLNTETVENAELVIYNLKGQRVKQLVNDQLTSGQHSVVWNGMDENNKFVSSGIYCYKLKAGIFEQTKKMILMK
jgi:Carboxypeptidase regulatory-like domain/FlgD Ig-like domain